MCLLLYIWRGQIILSFFFAVLAHCHAVFFLELLRCPANVIESTFKNDFRNAMIAVTQHIGKSNNNQLVFETFDLAIQKYPDAHPLFHSDRGFQYTSKRFKTNLDKQKMTQSMSRVGRCIDNGPMEGFWGILKCEMYYLSHFETYEELATAIEQFIHYYNHQRRQHKLNCLPLATYRSLLEAA